MPERPSPPGGPAPYQALGELVSILSNDPKYRPQVLSLLRAADPNMAIPELDVAKGLEDKLSAHQTKSDEREAEREKRLAALERQLSRDRWANERGLSDEEMTELETFAKDKKIGDPESALDYWRKTELGRPRSTSAPAEMDADARKALYGNARTRKDWVLKRGAEIIAEMRRGRRGA